MFLCALDLSRPLVDKREAIVVETSGVSFCESPPLLMQASSLALISLIAEVLLMNPSTADCKDSDLEKALKIRVIFSTLGSWRQEDQK